MLKVTEPQRTLKSEKRTTTLVVLVEPRDCQELTVRM
jgi:hypothetical protein